MMNIRRRTPTEGPLSKEGKGAIPVLPEDTSDSGGIWGGWPKWVLRKDKGKEKKKH